MFPHLRHQPRSLLRWVGLTTLAAVLYGIAGPLSAAETNSIQLQAHGAFVALSVADLDRAINWYTQHLDFKVSSRGENMDRKGALLIRPGMVIELAQFATAVSRESLTHDRDAHEVHGIFKIGLIVDNIQTVHQNMKDEGVTIFFPVVEASDGRQTFAITDPEGNIIQFFSR